MTMRLTKRGLSKNPRSLYIPRSPHATKNVFQIGFEIGFVQVGAGCAKCAACRIGKSDAVDTALHRAEIRKNKPNCVEIERFLRKLCRTAGSGARRKWAKAGNRAEIVLRRAMSKKAARKRFFQANVNRRGELFLEQMDGEAADFVLEIDGDRLAVLLLQAGLVEPEALAL